MKKRKSLRSRLNVLLWREGKWFVARCLEVEVASQGKTEKEALENIQEALELYFEDEKLPLPKAFPEVKLFSISPKISYA